MIERPRIVIKTNNSPSQVDDDVNFTRDQIRVSQIPVWLKSFRDQCWAIHENTPLPDSKNDAWRRTDIRSLNKRTLTISDYNNYVDQIKIPEIYLDRITDEDHGGQIFQSDEYAQIQVNAYLKNQGVIFTDLKTAEKEYPDQLRRILGRIVNPQEGKFASIAGALARFGAFLYIPKGLKVQKPLRSLLWGNLPDRAYFSHTLVLMDEGSSATFVQENASEAANRPSLHAGIVEIHILQGAHLNFIELQSWGEQIWNFSHERARLEQDASMDWIFGAMGSKLTKNFTTIDLAGQGSMGKMSGFYFTDHEQHLDHDTQQNHLAPRTTSDLLFKGALTGNSRSVWQGMIYVAPKAFKADGYQANRNLVLSQNARADSIPGLEILADDVRCTHGATVGKIDMDQSFYLQSRGIPKPEAEKLIVEGFFDPIMQRIPFEGVKHRFQKAIREKMRNI